jgi:hypothetical protein
MAEQTVIQEASSAPTLEMPKSGSQEYAEWRVTGDLPEPKPKVADTAAADTPKEAISEGDEPESDGVAEPPKKLQEHKGRGAEQRIKQLVAENKRIQAELAAARTPRETAQTDSSTAKQAPQNYADWRKEFRPSAWIEEYAKKNPQSSYEDANAAMADYLGEARDYFRNAEGERSKMAQGLEKKINDARSRYGEQFDEVLSPTIDRIVQDNRIAPAIKEMINDSDVIADLIFTIGSDSGTLADFIQLSKTQPGKALRYIAAVERGIQEELDKTASRSENGQFKTTTAEKEIAPVKRSPESAPEPPLEVGNRGNSSRDEADRAFQAIAKGDSSATRAWLKAENAKEMRRRRGI